MQRYSVTLSVSGVLPGNVIYTGIPNMCTTSLSKLLIKILIAVFFVRPLGLSIHNSSKSTINETFYTEN